MIGASLAIGDFMVMLITAIFWGAIGIAGWVLLGVGTFAGAVLVCRRLALHWRRPRNGASR